MKKDVNELKKMFLEILQNPSLSGQAANFTREALLNELKDEVLPASTPMHANSSPTLHSPSIHLPSAQGQPLILDNEVQNHYEVEESLNIMDKEKELILKALKKHKGRRKDASTDLGISERTLYRKIKEYDIEE